MIVHQASAGLAAGNQHWQEHHTDNHVHLSRSLSRVPAGGLSTPPGVPAIQVDEEDGVIQQGMSDRHLDARNHSALGFASRVLLPWAAILLDHTDKLDVARHDRGDGGDEGGAHEEVGEAGDVQKSGRITKAGGQEVGLDIGGGEGVGDIKTP